MTTRKAANKRTAPAVTVTRQDESNNPEIFRMYRLLYQRLRANSIVFDPLNTFHNGGDGAGDGE